MTKDISGKEIISMSALLAIKLTEKLDAEELLRLKLFVNQLSNNINTICLSKTLKKPEKTQNM